MATDQARRPAIARAVSLSLAAGSLLLFSQAAAAAASFGAINQFELSKSDPRGTVVADFDRDGHLDVAVAMAASVGGDGGISVAFGDGNGGFTNQGFIAIGFNPHTVAAGDFNGDGAPDIAAVMKGNNQQSAQLRLFLRDAPANSRSFTPSYVDSAASGRPQALAVGHFNAGSQLDIAVADGQNIDLYLGDGSGGFSGPTAIAASPFAPTDVAAGDIDGDADIDLALPSGVLLNNGSGSFSAASTGISFIGLHVAIGDMNRDGVADVVTANSSSVSIKLGQGGGSFSAGSSAVGFTDLRDLRLGDIDLDGKLDVLLSDGGDNRQKILYGDGRGGFIGAAQGIVAGGEPAEAVLGDWNEDGLPDLAVARDYASDQTPFLVVRLQQVAAGGGDRFRFGSAGYGIGEAADSITISVLRMDGDAGVASVEYLSSNGTASAADYTTTSGRLNFPAGVVAQQFSVGLIDDSDFEGDETVQLSLLNPSGAVLGSPASATLTLIDNESPTASADNYGPLDQGAQLNVAAPGVLGNDGNPVGSVSADLVSDVANGTLTLNAGGSFSYRHNGSDTASDSFQYRALSGAGSSSPTVIVNIAINRVDLIPQAQPDSFQMAEDTILSGNLLADNGSGADNPGNQVWSVTEETASSGNLSLNSDGSFSYAPVTDFPHALPSDTDSFSYRITDADGQTSIGAVTISVLQINDTPQPIGQNLSATAGVALPITLRAADAEGDALSFNIAQAAGKGSIVHTPGSANLSYSANPGATGVDVFTFTASDAQATSGATAVLITILPGSAGSAPSATPQSVLVDEDQSLAISLAGSDPDGDPISAFTLTSVPANGVLSGTPPSVSYAPNADFNGADSFQFTVTAGGETSLPATVSIVINARNDAPQALADSALVSAGDSLSVPAPGLLGNDSDVDLDPLSVLAAPLVDVLHGSLLLAADGGWQYTPAAGYLGADSFSYQIADGAGGTASAQVSISVSPGAALLAGMNLLGVRVDSARVADSYSLLQRLGPPSAIERIQRYDAASGRYRETRYDALGQPSGDNTPLRPGEGWVVYALAAGTVPNDPNQPCGSATLTVGENLVGFPCEISGLSAAQLLANLGGSVAVSGVRGFDPATGYFQSLAYDASSSLRGEDFQISSGRAYLIFARQPITLPLQ